MFIQIVDYISLKFAYILNVELEQRVFPDEKNTSIIEKGISLRFVCVCMYKTDGIASLNINCERGADFRFRENSLQCAQFSQVNVILLYMTV